MSDFLQNIIARKRAEIQRRQRFAPMYRHAAPVARGFDTAAWHRQPGQPLRVIAEIKFRSPSRGVIRQRHPGRVATLAQAYERGGASAISVLADATGFGGTPLDLRRAGAVTRLPLLFKEFVLDPVQLDLALQVGATLCLLIVRVLDATALPTLIDACRARGLVPLVEVADRDELAVALHSTACLIGVNARNLRTFGVDMAAANALIDAIPKDRVALWLSGVRDGRDFARVAASRADAVLIGESLMTATDPAAHLEALRQTACTTGFAS